MENINITSNPSDEGGEIQISLQNVYFEYESNDDSPPKEVLHGISIDIRRGDGPEDRVITIKGVEL